MDQIAYYALRSSVRPGVTGWAQVRYGYANNLEEETEKMRYDLYYIKHRSLWLDVQILLQTIRVLLLDRRSHEAAHLPPALAARNEAIAERATTARTA
jgi:lipopolysaccharide/colanic/teichoic acid biosynthesis glycosyltransferase